MAISKRVQGSEKVTRAFPIPSVALCLILMLAGGCLNPPQYTYQRYDEQGTAAFQRGDLAASEQAFDQALVNAQRGPFLDKEVSTALFNLGRVKRLLCKDAEAEQLLRQSKDVGEKAWGPESPLVSRRLLELAKLYYNQDRFNEAVTLMQRGVPIAEKQDVAHLTPAGLAYTLDIYADALRKTNRESEAQVVEDRAKALRTRPDYSALREKAWRAQEGECKGRKR